MALGIIKVWGSVELLRFKVTGLFPFPGVSLLPILAYLLHHPQSISFEFPSSGCW